MTRLGLGRKPRFDVTEVPDIGRLKGRVLFIGLGAMKTATTWVSHYLKNHPDVYHSQINEMNFWNKLDPNQLDTAGSTSFMWRMKKILLENGTQFPPTLRNWEKLQTLAELDDLRTPKDYESYFARRIGNETHFGEICPQYSLMPPATYRRIADLGYETRLMFFMRDPTDRLASNIQHSLRRSHFDVDTVIENLTQDNTRYQRSDYSLTLEAYRQSGVDIPLKTFVYEELFSDDSLRDLCNFLGIAYRSSDFEQRINATRGVVVTPEQKQRIREKLDPLYVKLGEYLDEKPPSWRW